MSVHGIRRPGTAQSLSLAFASATLFIGSSNLAFAQTSPPVVAFVDVNVISMNGDGIARGQTVVVERGRIVAIGRLTPPADAVVVEGTGRFLLPGLTDSHVHLTTDMPWAPQRPDFGEAPLYLAHGVTTVVNLRGTPVQLDWRRRIESGELIGPTIYTAGDFVNEPRVTTPDEVQQDIAAQAREGYDLIKFHEIFVPGVGFTTTRGLSRESYVRMFDAARRAGVPVVGHAPVNLGLSALVAASGGAVAHTGELVRLYLRPPFWTFLAATAALVILFAVSAGWMVAALVRRWRGHALSSRALARAKTLIVSVFAAFVAAFVCGSFVGPGGLFYDSVGWRAVFVAVLTTLLIGSLLAVVASLKVWRDTSVSMTARLPVMTAAVVIAAAVSTPSIYWIQSVWRNTDSGMSRMATQLRNAGVSVQTTLVVYETGFGGPEASARVLADRVFVRLLPQTQTLWRELADRPRPGVVGALIDMPPRYAEYTQTIARVLHRNGVQLIAGTDAMGLPMVMPGSSLLRELYLLRRSGLTPYEVIRTATVNPARFLGKQNEFGTIAVGTRADLLLLERNPLEDLSALNQPLGVMVRGRWLARERLHALLPASAAGRPNRN